MPGEVSGASNGPRALTLQSTTVNVQINPNVEARLAACARSIGESLEEYIQRLLEREAPAPANTPGPDPMIAAQKNKAFRAWANSFPANMPLLSPEDITREKIYERD